MRILPPASFPGFLRRLLVELGLVVAVASAGAQFNPAVIKQRAGTYTSKSGQFTVIGHEPGSPMGPPSLSLIRDDYLQMDPGVLLLTCEAIKSEFNRTLGTPNDWRGAITIIVRGQASADEPVTVQPQRYPTGWRYQIVVPGQVERRELIHVVVRVLLMEVANRANNTLRPVEAPLWLEEGLTGHLFARHGRTLVPGKQTVIDHRSSSRDVYAGVREHLRLFRAPPFSSLSLPWANQLTGLDGETFRHCAHLFVGELLTLPDSPALLRQTLDLLPNYLNRQLAFNKAFRPLFKSTLDVEKWWSVVIVSFQSRDENLRWSEARSIEQLEAVIRQTVEVRLATNAVPTRTELSLQELIERTDFPAHKRVLAQSIQQLTAIQHHSKKDLARLILDYRRTLETYLHTVGESSSARSKHPVSARVARNTAIRDLGLLDQIRRDILLVAQPDEPPEEGLERVERLLREAGLP